MDSVLLKDALKPPHGIEVLSDQHRMVGVSENEAGIVIIVVPHHRIHHNFCLHDVIVLRLIIQYKPLLVEKELGIC